MKRIVVMGGGLIGARHIDAVQANPATTLVGLIDPDPRIKTAPGVKRYADIADVTEDVDGVIIATPTGMHADHGIAAAARGWHVLIEKPVAGDLESAHALQSALERFNVRSLVGHHRRYHARVNQLRRLIMDGVIGTPVTASLIWAMRKPDAYFEGNWRTAGGSPVMINLVHDLDILRFVLGEVTDIACLAGASQRGGGRIESGAIALRMAQGATATISFADTAPSPWGFEAGTGENPNIGTTSQDMMWITGTSGGISFPTMTLWHGTDWSRPAQTVDLSVEVNRQTPLDAQLDHFVAVMEGAEPRIDVADATRTLALALQIEEELSGKST